MFKTVLIVDDAAFMRRFLRDILEKGGFVVVGEAEDGKVAFERYKELKPDIVSLDITMPEMNGLECLKKIREFDKEAKVVMCSAMGQQSMVIQAIQLGAKDFIVKPFNGDRVITAFSKL